MSLLFPLWLVKMSAVKKAHCQTEPDLIYTEHINLNALWVLHLSKCFLNSVVLCLFVLSLINKWPGISVAGAEWCHIRGAPSVSGWRSKRDGSLSCTGETCGKRSIGQNAISSLYRALKALGTDGHISGRQKVHEGLRFPPVWIFVSAWVCVCAGLHMCSHSWGERAC